MAYKSQQFYFCFININSIVNINPFSMDLPKRDEIKNKLKGFLQMYFTWYLQKGTNLYVLWFPTYTISF